MDWPHCRAIDLKQGVTKHRQQGAATLRSVLLVFTGSLLLLVILATASVSFDRFRDYVSGQLKGHARDGATAIGLSLSNAIDGRDPVAAASLIDAVFDSGRYLRVSYLDNQGNLVAGREASLSGLPVPGWFVDIVGLPNPVGEAEVVRGWSRLGKVTVSSHPGQAYEDLWNLAVDITLGAIAVGGLGLLMLLWLIHRALRPLQALAAQARALGNRDFRQRIKQTSTRELNEVTHALNQMADDLGRLFDGQARLIENLRHITNEDALTGLASRAAFGQRLMAAVESEDHAAPGVLLLVQLSDFARYNRNHGREEADAVLVKVADCLKEFVRSHAGAFAGRHIGAEFSVFLAGASMADGLIWGRQLVGEMDLCYFGERGAEHQAVHAGLAEVDQGHRVRDLWAAADEALRQAQAGGVSGCYHADPDRPTHRNSHHWRELIENAISNEHLSLWLQPMIGMASGNTEFHQVSSRLEIEDGPVKAGVFVPMAEHFGLVAGIDRQVVVKAMALLREEPGKRLAMTLGEGSVASADFRMELIQRLQNSGPERQRLMLGISEHALHQNRTQVSSLVRSLNDLSVPVIVDRFGVGGVPFSYLRNLSFQAVRIDHSFVRNIDGHSDNRFFLESVVSITHSTGKQVYVSGVETAAEYSVLRDIGVDGAMGYYLERPFRLDHSE